ncbi:MAG: lipase family protein [Acidobacteriota bacterium]
MYKNIIRLIIFILVILLINCAVDETVEQEILKSYRTLTPVTVTTDLIDQIINDLNYPDFNDNQVRQLITYPVKIYEVTYRTKYKGSEIIASGAVTIPETGEALPVLSYHHGTIFRDSRAPSNYKGGMDMEAETALNIVFGSTGFICAAPDLIGYGDSTDRLHPYHLSHPTATASLDMLRAVKELCVKLGKEINGKYFITGYSEGGYAAMAVQKEIRQNHSSDFPVTASSLGAGAYHLSETVKRMSAGNTLISPAYIVFLITAYNDYYGWGRDLSAIFQEPYNGHISGGILNGDLTQSQINNMLTTSTTKLFTGQFLNDFRGGGEEQLKAAFSENDLYNNWAPKVPTRLYHGSWDKTVPPFNSETAYSSFVQSGSGSVEYISLKRKDHETAIVPFIKATILWFNSL